MQNYTFYCIKAFSKVYQKSNLNNKSEQIGKICNGVYPMIRGVYSLFLWEKTATGKEW